MNDDAHADDNSAKGASESAEDDVGKAKTLYLRSETVYDVKASPNWILIVAVERSRGRGDRFPLSLPKLNLNWGLNSPNHPK